jgi:hypothetical protein
MGTPHKHAAIIKQWADGQQIQARQYDEDEWDDIASPQWHPNLQYRVKPERAYPTTQMEPSDLWEIYDRLNLSGGKSLVTVVNAALRHAIDHDQVVPMAEVQEVARQLAEQGRDKAKANQNIDFTIKAGDVVESPHFTLSRLIVVDVNWALRAVALRLGQDGGIVVWPAEGLSKIATVKD